MTTLAVKISGVPSNPDVRSVEAPGETGKLKVNNGTILITDASGDVVVKSVPLDYAAASNNATGQVITDIPANSAFVYIVANVPTPTGNLSSVKIQTMNITSQSDYTNVALANAGGDAAAISPAPDAASPATASITLVPLVSRVELHSIKGVANMADNTDDDYVKITGFKVDGVYLDSYYPQFTLAGLESGALVDEGSDTGFTIADVGPWTADATPVAKPTAPTVWAHNVVAKGAPRFIIKISEVTAEDKDGPVTEVVTPEDPDPVTLSGKTFWLSMNTTQPYNGVTSFERGKIYVVEALEFNSNHLFTLPNPVQLDLKVNVTVQDWVIEKVTGNL